MVEGPRLVAVPLKGSASIIHQVTHVLFMSYSKEEWDTCNLRHSPGAGCFPLSWPITALRISPWRYCNLFILRLKQSCDENFLYCLYKNPCLFPCFYIEFIFTLFGSVPVCCEVHACVTSAFEDQVNILADFSLKQSLIWLTYFKQ